MTAWFPPGVESEWAPCDHCGTGDERVLFEGPDRLHHLPGQFRVVECPECGWLRQNPRPTAETMGYYYPRDFVSFVRAVEDERRAWRRWDRRYGILKQRWAVERLQPRGRLLDVGCGTGIFLHEMAGAGWDVVGVEPHREAGDYARGRFGVQVHRGTLGQIRLPSASFDVVTLWDVLEHLHTPWADLRGLHRLLKDEGLLVVQIPNLESLEARWFGPLWFGWELPRHLYFFPRQRIACALSELGFALERVQVIASSHAAFMLTLRFCLEGRRRLPTRWREFVLRLGHTMLVRLTCAPLFWVISQARLAAVITLFARKRR